MSKTKLIVAVSAIALMAGALAYTDAPTEASDGASASIAALKTSLGNPADLEVDDVRVTSAGVACITYRASDDTGGKKRAQAVVEGDEVLHSSSRGSQFAKAWKRQCAGSGDDTE